MPNPDRTLDGRALARLRQSHGFTNETLAHACGLAVSTVARWMNRVVGCYPSSLEVLVKAINERGEALGLPPITTAALTESAHDGLTVGGCLPDFLEWQKRCDGETLVIRVIGLDLSDAWINFERVVTSPLVRATAVAVRLVALADRVDTSGVEACVARTVDTWSRAAGGYVAQAIAGVTEYHGGKSLGLAVRRYADVPDWHGIVAEIGGRRRYYVTICHVRDDGIPQFDFGEGSYKAISEGDADPELAYYRDQFNARFEHLWDGAAGTEVTATGPARSG